MLIDGIVETETVAIADAVHVPVPDNTVYVVVVVGLTFTVAELGGVVPELAVQTNGATPVVVNVTVCPAQIVESEGVMLIEGVVEIETVATAEVVQLPVPEITV